MFFNIYDLIFVVPATLLAFYAQYKVTSTFKKHLSFEASKRFTGGEVARRILDQNGLQDVEVEMTEGFLSDHYNPKDKTVRLSPEVYRGTSVSSLGVAAHETGHAMQHSEKYMPLAIRAAFVPAANFGSWLAMPLILLGVFIKSTGLLWLGVIAFSVAVLFQIITLPVEFNASRRAMLALNNGGFLTHDELKPTKKVLGAAALTYVAAAIASIAQLVSFILSLVTQGGDE